MGIDTSTRRSMSNGPSARSTPQGSTHRARRLIFLRAIIWGLVGLLCAPLFIGLSAMFKHLGAGLAAYIAAAALTGGAGAALYTGREVALLGTGVGVGAGVLSLMLGPHLVSFQHAVLIAGVIAALIMFHPVFQARCIPQLPTRVMAGVTTGALCGAALGVAEPLHPAPISTFAVLSFLVSVNGVLYVASLGPLLSVTRRMHLTFLPCNWVEALVAGPLAAIAAGSVWIMAGPFLGEHGQLLQATSDAVYRQLPMALLGGIFGGGLAGGLLGVFGFPWVHENR
jgi:hypothetical protein